MFIPLQLSSPGKEKIVNENFALQEAWNKGVIDRNLLSPPTSPSSDGLYIPAATATDAWVGKENKLLWWNPDGYWRSYNPTDKQKIISQLEPAYYVFDAANLRWYTARYQTVVTEYLADMTALNALTNMIQGDISEVLDVDGAGNSGWFIYAGTWRRLVEENNSGNAGEEF